MPKNINRRLDKFSFNNRVILPIGILSPFFLKKSKLIIMIGKIKKGIAPTRPKMKPKMVIRQMPKIEE